MTRPVTVGPGVLVAADVCPELGPIVAATLECLRRDRLPLSSDAAETLEQIVRAGQLWRRSEVPSEPISVPFVDDGGSETGEWLSVRETAEILSIGERGVVKRITVGTLGARKVRGAWRIDPRSLGKEGA